MKLYFVPGACSLAVDIALREAGIAFEGIEVDLASRTCADGKAFADVSAKGYVPVLIDADGQTITEMVAVLYTVAEKSGELAAVGPTRLIEMLAFISTELHRNFRSFYRGAEAPELERQKQEIAKRLATIDGLLTGDYLLGAEKPGVADAYLFTILFWCDFTQLPKPPRLAKYQARMAKRTAVTEALAFEGLGAR